MVPPRLEQQYGNYMNVSSVNQIPGSAQPFGVSTPFSVCCLCFGLVTERARFRQHLSSTWFTEQYRGGPACVCECKTIQSNYWAQKSASQMGSRTSPHKERSQIHAWISSQACHEATSGKWYVFCWWCVDMSRWAFSEEGAAGHFTYCSI